MFRIRRVFDGFLPRDKAAIAEVQHILLQSFPESHEDDYLRIREKLQDPLLFRYRSILYVAEQGSGILGFALMLHVPDENFCFLDYISTIPKRSGGGVGGALYSRLRSEASALNVVGIFMECPADDPKICRDASLLAVNRARMRFYERFGAVPVIGTEYETPFKPTDACPPSLVFDSLGRDAPLSRSKARRIVRAVLERKYGNRCPEGYIDMVTASFTDDPVRLRPFRNANDVPQKPASTPGILMTVNDRHDIHHVHERGYVESPIRVKSILNGLEPSGLMERITLRHFGEKYITAVHSKDMVKYFRRVARNLEPGKSIYPYVFPIRNRTKPPKELPVRAGYYCMDTFTPLNANAYAAARRAVDCALTLAEELLAGARLGYALVRPPGHHAERNAFGGFCYFNSCAAAAHHLSSYGRVAVLDIDYHHGNGTQEIFYSRGDVLTVSIHGHPRFAYPYFSGFADEQGQGEGRGANINHPLSEHVNGAAYAKVLDKAVKQILRFDPGFLIIALGLDTAKGDPTGTWALSSKDFETMGKTIGALNLPTLVVQEGGYRIRSLGANARGFFRGLAG